MARNIDRYTADMKAAEAAGRSSTRGLLHTQVRGCWLWVTFGWVPPSPHLLEYLLVQAAQPACRRLLLSLALAPSHTAASPLVLALTYGCYRPRRR
eukprot:1967604-Prymnesium_polylepis.2